MREVYLGRQPILDREMRIFGYELLFRDREENFAYIKDSIEATARVVMNLLAYMDFKDIIGNKKGFINVSPEFIEGDLVDLLPANKIVLEISSVEKINKFIIDSINKVKEKGFQVALDNVSFNELLSPALESVDFVKVNIKNYTDLELKELVDFLKKYSIKLIAVKVETEKDYFFTKELGFDYFQGFFFEKPTLKKEKKLTSYKIALLKLLKMAILEKSMDEIAEVIKGYPDLAYKLLKYVNSPFFYLRHKIHSVKQALSFLGYQNIQKWAVLQLFASEGGDIKANPFLERAVIRGKMMEILMAKITTDIDMIEKGYITGMLSLIATVLYRPIEEILGELYIDEDIKKAILNGEGKLGKVLTAIISLEKDDIDKARSSLEQLNLGLEDLLEAELEAITYYENFMESQ
ncbi:EAL and modified HD-GYP domain-containing signal transduction protein [Persephonella hydrogeniphila]|uniref:EAL and modified HD-GYP domain-containing signal transduction protein n=1 Tax=Persephonella hydrogeniphila TaxID=198703 RepID=A0A285NHE6_9AQUI|nr:HDOD domain-containing protein [Persephonella hydrogeniphila]SNZ08914.1 EAL and modified HD-GYP domain-containing signal transduction protein [Persephonella hydrogeniphila]